MYSIFMTSKESRRSEGERLAREVIGSAIIIAGVGYLAKSLHKSGHPNLARTVEVTAVAIKAGHARRFLTPKEK